MTNVTAVDIKALQAATTVVRVGGFTAEVAELGGVRYMGAGDFVMVPPMGVQPSRYSLSRHEYARRALKQTHVNPTHVTYVAESTRVQPSCRSLSLRAYALRAFKQKGQVLLKCPVILSAAGVPTVVCSREELVPYTRPDYRRADLPALTVEAAQSRLMCRWCATGYAPGEGPDVGAAVIPWPLPHRETVFDSSYMWANAMEQAAIDCAIDQRARQSRLKDVKGAVDTVVDAKATAVAAVVTEIAMDPQSPYVLLKADGTFACFLVLDLGVSDCEYRIYIGGSVDEAHIAQSERAHVVCRKENMELLVDSKVVKINSFSNFAQLSRQHAYHARPVFVKRWSGLNVVQRDLSALTPAMNTFVDDGCHCIPRELLTAPMVHGISVILVMPRAKANPSATASASASASTAAGDKPADAR